MDQDVKEALARAVNALDGKILALRYAIDMLIERDPEPDVARRAVVAHLDGFIALAASGIVSRERFEAAKEIQVALAHRAMP